MYYNIFINYSIIKERLLMDKLTVREFINKFDNGYFDTDDINIQIEAGWYDWFCTDKALQNKTKVLGKKIKCISQLGLFDIDSSYVYMKNCCPLYGKLYDCFGICDIETKKMVMFIALKLGFDIEEYKNKTEILYMNDKSRYFDSWKEAKVFLSELTNKVK